MLTGSAAEQSNTALRGRVRFNYGWYLAVLIDGQSEGRQPME